MLLPLLRHFPQHRWRWLPKLYQNRTASLFTTPATLCENSEQVGNRRDHLGMSLTMDEASEYLENVLKIPTDPATVAREDRLKFLGLVQRKTKEVQPYTNVCFMEGQSCPSPAEGKAMMFERRGGGCLYLSGFLAALLRAIGYDAHIIPISLPKARSPVFASHGAVVVKDMTEPGSNHIVDPSGRYPITDPIAVDFARVSPEYCLIDQQRMRYFRDAPGVVRLCSEVTNGTVLTPRHDPNHYHEAGRVWSHTYTYHVKQTTPYSDCHTTAEKLVANSNLFPDAHWNVVITGFSVRGIFTFIVGDTCTEFHSDGTKTKVKFTTDQEVIDNAIKCFPQYSPASLKKAIDYTKLVTSRMKP